jgi:hypothetical protein
MFADTVWSDATNTDRANTCLTNDALKWTEGHPWFLETLVCTSGAVPFRRIRAGPPPLSSGVRQIVRPSGMLLAETGARGRRTSSRARGRPPHQPAGPL